MALVSNKVHHEFLPKKSKLMLCFPCLTGCTLLTRWSASVIKASDTKAFNGLQCYNNNFLV